MGRQTVLSIDAMGGDRGPAAVISGMAKSAEKNSDIRFLLHGAQDQLEPLLRRRGALAAITEICPASAVIPMGEKPSLALRRGRDSSMWNTVDAVASGRAQVAVSCGNTGALMAMSKLRLRLAPGIDRPAIAVLWPSRNPAGYNVFLDVGADVRAEPDSLLQFAIMGAEYARVCLRLEAPRVGLLNVGTEEHKGSAGVHEAHERLTALAADPRRGFRYVGYVEGGDITGQNVDVIVTDGFTGNIALKTAEGTAALIGSFISEAFGATILSRIAKLFAAGALLRLKKRIDPRRVNGGVFLGLTGAVVKSHGSADATGFSAAIKLAFRMAQDGFAEKVAERVAAGRAGGPDALGSLAGTGQPE